MKRLVFLFVFFGFQLAYADEILDPWILEGKSGRSQIKNAECNFWVKDIGLYKRGQRIVLSSQFISDHATVVTEMTGKQYELVLRAKNAVFSFDQWDGKNYDGSAIRYEIQSLKNGNRNLVIQPLDLDKFRNEFHSSFVTTVLYKGEVPVSFKTEYFLFSLKSKSYVKSFEDTCVLKEGA